METNFTNFCMLSTETHHAAWMHTKTYMSLNVYQIKEARMQERTFLFYPSAPPFIHTIRLPPRVDYLSTPHLAGAPAHIAWQCQCSTRETTGGMRGPGPEIIEQLKIDPRNGDVAFPNPLTSNPSDVCLYCLVCFTIRVRLVKLRKVRMLWRWRGSTQGPKVTLSFTCVWFQQVKDPFCVWMLCCRRLLRWTLICATTIAFNKLYISSHASVGSSVRTIVWLHLHKDIRTKTMAQSFIFRKDTQGWSNTLTILTQWTQKQHKNKPEHKGEDYKHLDK